jgi:hypothetical protein
VITIDEEEVWDKILAKWDWCLSFPPASGLVYGSGHLVQQLVRDGEASFALADIQWSMRIIASSGISFLLVALNCSLVWRFLTRRERVVTLMRPL